MNLKEKIAGATGKLRIVVQDETTGVIKHDIETTNLVVNTGLNYIASRMVGTAKNVMSHMAVGSSDTAAAPEDTNVGSILGSRKALTSATATANAVEYQATFAAGEGTGAVKEAGIFNASTSGDMLCRTVFDVINKGASDSMTITWTVTVS